MGNLFDGIIKEDSISPVENVVIKYLNWQNQRNIPQEIEKMKNNPNTVLGLINPAGGLSKVKSFLKRSETGTQSWISNTGREYILGDRQSHVSFVYKLKQLFKKDDMSGGQYDLYDRGWIRKADSGHYSISKIDKKTVNLIRKNVAKDKNTTENIIIDVYNSPLTGTTFTAETEKFIKHGYKILKIKSGLPLSIGD